ncbi:MAG: peptide chain release factor 1 [Prevotella sp.]|nr:peptide chain release factor 1 [Prevotella sp.]
MTIQDLITEQKNRIRTLKYNDDVIIPYYEYPDMDSYYCWLEKVKRFLVINYPKDKHVEEFETISNESLWPDQQQKLLAILEAFAVLPQFIPQTKNLSKNISHSRESINVTTNINNSNSQSQHQEQSMAVDLFIEAIKDDLTGRQIKELKTVVAEADNNLEKARPEIIEKLKSFGTDVASNVVANLLTNPVIWSGL